MVLTVIVAVDVLAGLRENIRRTRVVLVVQVHIFDGVGGAGPRALPRSANFARCSTFWVVCHEHSGETVVGSFSLHVSVIRHGVVLLLRRCMANNSLRHRFAHHIGVICFSIMLLLHNITLVISKMFVRATTGAGA